MVLNSTAARNTVAVTVSVESLPIVYTDMYDTGIKVYTGMKALGLCDVFLSNCKLLCKYWIEKAFKDLK